MTRRGTETEFELTTIERLEQLNYEYIHGEELQRPLDEVVLKNALRAFLKNNYPDLPNSALDEAVSKFANPQGVDTLRRNRSFHQDVTRGIELKVKYEDGKKEVKHIYPINWEDPVIETFQSIT